MGRCFADLGRDVLSQRQTNRAHSKYSFLTMGKGGEKQEDPGTSSAPPAENVDGPRKDFHWDEGGEPHALRKAEILKAHPEIRELMGPDPMTKYQVFAVVAAQVAMAWWASRQTGGLVPWRTSWAARRTACSWACTKYRTTWRSSSRRSGAWC